MYSVTPYNVVLQLVYSARQRITLGRAAKKAKQLALAFQGGNKAPSYIVPEASWQLESQATYDAHRPSTVCTEYMDHRIHVDVALHWKQHICLSSA